MKTPVQTVNLSFTQIDCENELLVEQEDIINTFEGMAKHLFQGTSAE